MSDDSINYLPLADVKEKSRSSLLNSQIICDCSNTSDGQNQMNIFQAIILNKKLVYEMLDTSKHDYISLIKSTDSMGRTPLNLACFYGEVDIVRTILNTEAADIEKADKNNWSPLFVASLNGQEEIVELLLGNNANVNVVDKIFEWTPLLASVWNGHVEIYKKLLKAHSSLISKDKNGQNALFLAAQRNRIELIDLLLEEEAIDINGIDNYGRTPIYIAIQSRNFHVVEKLSQRGADLEIPDIDGRKPLFVANKLGYDEITTLLVDIGVNIDSLQEDRLEGYGEAVSPCKGDFTEFAKTSSKMKVIVMCAEKDANRLWCGCNDGSIIIWNLKDRSQIAFLERIQKTTIHHMIFNDNSGTVWSLSGSQDIYIWRYKELQSFSTIEMIDKITPGPELYCLYKYEGEIYGGSKLLFTWDSSNPGNQKNVELDTSVIRLHEYENLISTLLIHRDRIYCVIKKIVFTYELKTFTFKGLFTGHHDLITSLVIVEDFLWSASRDDSIRIWDINTQQCIKVLSNAGGGEVSVLLLTQNNQILSGGKDGLIRSWDAQLQNWKRTFPSIHEKRPLTTFHWNDQTSELWVGCLDKNISIWK